MNPFNNFDIIYYINLDKREDRKTQLLNELTKMNIDMNKVKRITGVLDENGKIGCFQAHINTLLNFEQSNLNNCLILEDDFVFKNNQIETFKTLNKFWSSGESWDLLMISGQIKTCEKTKHPFLFKVSNGQTTSGYAVNKQFLQTLLTNYKTGIENIKKNKGCAIDIYWKSLQPFSKWYVLYPKLGFQKPDYSDIEKRNVDYKQEHYDIEKNIK